MNKLENFPSAYYVTLEESVDRQKNIQSQFADYNISPIPIISKRYSESSDIVKGNYISTMDLGTIGCAVSHLKVIKKWYNETDEPYAFFCEDDLSLETVKYWNFTWEEFIESIPEDADCVQLLRLREGGNFSDFTFRKREWNDWSVTAYIITREYAAKIISEHCIGDEYHLDIKGQNCMPLVEYIIFNYGITYSVPFFVEDNNFKTTFSKSLNYNEELHADTHLKSYEIVLDWWKSSGKNLLLKDFLIPKIKSKKIVDYFTFFAPTGRQMLKLRINILKEYVDEFVICESNKTQSGTPIQYELRNILKELNLSDCNIRIIDLNIPDDEDLDIQSIDHHNCYDNNSSNLNSIRSRVRERMQKDALLSVINDYSDDTVFIHSDIDEIISPSVITYISDTARQNSDVVIRVPLVHLEGRADMRVHVRDSNEPKEWSGMFVTTKKHLTKATPTQIRSNVFNPFPIVFLTENGNVLKDLGWHFSWMGNSDTRNIKCKAFTHHDDKFSYLTASKYSAQDMEEFQKKLKLEDGQIPPSGDKNMILRYYPTENLPKEIFIFDDIAEFLLPKNTEKETVQILYEQNEIEKLLSQYSLDTENGEHNFNLAFWYENGGHTAPAVSYYLRCAERSEDKNLSYEALIRASHCYAKQGTRDSSSKCLLQQALSLCPNRPEAYFLLSKFSQIRNCWTDCYNFADMGLIFSDFSVEPLRTNVEYPGKYGLLYLKAESGWWWGKVEETKNLLIEVKSDNSISTEYNDLVDNFASKIGFEIQILDEKFTLPEKFDWGELTYEDMITIDREIIHENVYGFWRGVNKDDIVMDIGASVGPFTCLALHNDAKKVYCVEPSKTLSGTLLKNVSQYLNKYNESPIALINKAIIGNEYDKVNIFGSNKEFETTTFKQIIQDNNIDYINCLKIDCEGGEYNIFIEENMNFLLNNVEFISMEVHLKLDGMREKFINFRDNYLTKFKDYKVMSCTRQNISWRNSIDLKEYIFYDEFVYNYNCEFMIYILNK